jgi:hypothetical protein
MLSRAPFRGGLIIILAAAFVTAAPPLCAQQAPALSAWDRAVGHMQSGNPQAALPDLEALVHDHPQEAKYRLELAYALFLRGSDIRAAHHLQQVKGAALSPAQRAAVTRIEARIQDRKVWTYRLGISVQPSTNAGRGTSAETISIGDLVFAIPQAAQSRSGTGYQLNAGATALPRISGRLRGTLSFDTLIKHYSARRLRETLAVGRAGLRWYGQNNTSFVEGGLLGGVVYAAGTRHSTRAGFFAALAAPLGTRAGLQLAVEHYRQDHVTFTAADGHRSVITGAVNYALSGQAVLRLQGYAIRTQAQLPTVSGWETALTLGGRYAFRGGLVAGLSVTAGRTSRDGINPLLGAARSDTLAAVEAEFYNTRLKFGPFVPTLKARMERNRSNVALNDYRASSVTFGIRTSF